jgi:hypothetical protein
LRDEWSPEPSPQKQTARRKAFNFNSLLHSPKSSAAVAPSPSPSMARVASVASAASTVGAAAAALKASRPGLARSVTGAAVSVTLGSASPPAPCTSIDAGRHRATTSGVGGNGLYGDMPFAPTSPTLVPALYSPSLSPFTSPAAASLNAVSVSGLESPVLHPSAHALTAHGRKVPSLGDALSTPLSTAAAPVSPPAGNGIQSPSGQRPMPPLRLPSTLAARAARGADQ